MTYSNNLAAKLSDKHLLKHPFYQAWSAGAVPMETLRLYAEQYYHHVKAFPRYVSATHSNCDSIEARQFLLENLIDEEQGPNHHPELWLRFAEGMGCERQQTQSAEWMPATEKLVNTFFDQCKKSYASGLGTLFAYEHQIPEVATFKIDALKKHYAIDEASTLEFFEVHRKADVYHTETLKKLLDGLTDEEKLEVENSAQIAADHLWKFLDGIQQTMAC